VGETTYDGIVGVMKYHSSQINVRSVLYTPVQKVLADLKVLQRGLAATEASITVYKTPLKMLSPPRKTEKDGIFNKSKERSRQSSFHLKRNYG